MHFNPTLGLILTLQEVHENAWLLGLYFNPTLGLILTACLFQVGTQLINFNPTLGLILTELRGKAPATKVEISILP